MTRKDFELIARCIRNAAEAHGQASSATLIAQNFAVELRSTNPNFDSARFLRACGVEG